MNSNSRFKFRLYLAGETQNALEAVANLTALCRACVPNRYDIEIVDIAREPERALEDHVYMTPMLLKLSPGPCRRVVGTLSHPETLKDTLGLASRAEVAA